MELAPGAMTDNLGGVDHSGTFDCDQSSSFGA